MTVKRLIGYGGLAAILLGSILPWASGPFGISVSGLGGSGSGGDGIVTLILGLVALATFAAGTRDMRRHLGWVITTMALGVLVALVAGIDTGNIMSVPYVAWVPLTTFPLCSGGRPREMTLWWPRRLAPWLSV